MSHSVLSSSEAQTRRIAAELAQRLREGETVLLSGELGAGKTTFVRGYLEGLGYGGPVRSPTFNLIQTFSTSPPIMHADLYRVRSHEGLGIEDYLATHVCLIEWPDRAGGLIEAGECWRINLVIEAEKRRIDIKSPGEA